MRQVMWIFGAHWITVNVRCESDFQYHEPKYSSDLTVTATKTQMTRRNYPKQNERKRQWEHNRDTLLTKEPETELSALYWYYKLWLGFFNTFSPW